MFRCMGADPIFLTRAAEGLDRRGFTLDEIEKMMAAGVIDSDEKFELIDHPLYDGLIEEWANKTGRQSRPNHAP